MIRFHPATEEEEVAYVSLFSYFSSRGRFGVVADGNRSIKDIYLVPLSAKESIPLMLQPFDGPGMLMILRPLIVFYDQCMHCWVWASIYGNTSKVQE